MKRFVVILLAFSLSAAMLLCSCADNTVTEPDVTTQGGDTAPDVSEAKHEITISDVESILAENGLRTNINKWNADGGVWHGGMQMRVCHTERGTYCAFAKEFGTNSVDGIQKFYVTKTDNDGTSSILYYGEFESDDAEITINVVQDTTGDIFVSAISETFHGVYVFDRDTDQVTEYEMDPELKAESKLGYSQVMYDFDNRMMYAFLICGSGTDVETIGDSIIEWYSFNLDTKEWSDSSILVRTEDIGRHGYLYPFPDGKGGAYIAAIRNEYVEYLGDRFSVSDTYVWDRLGLFYIPDLSTGEGSSYTLVHEEDGSRGLEGIWSHVHPNQYGDVYVDSNGYMHITYRYCLMDYTGGHEDFDNQLEYRHAIYDGMECIYNEKLDVRDEDHMYYRPMVRQSTDGKLHLINAKMWTMPIEIDFYSAEDELGKEWKYEKTVTLDEGVNTDSLSLSGVRDGSVQDDVLSCFFYGYYNLNNTAYTFNIDLEDYSVTELVNILDGFDIQLDWRYDERMPYADHQTQIVKCENATYAAFVYDYNKEENSEYFHIAKIDADGKATILYSGSYPSSQDKFLSMTEAEGGKIYVCPPSGSSVLVIDTNTDEVTEEKRTETVISQNVYPQQSDMIFDSEGNGYYLYTLPTDAFGIAKLSADNEKSAVVLKKSNEYIFDRELTGGYTEMYTLPTENGGVYMVGAREVFLPDLDGELDYMGYTKTVKDSLMLFYIPDIAGENEAKCAEIAAPYTSQGGDGIWSVADVKDAYIDSNGKLNVLYSYYHFDFDDANRRENSELIEKTLKFFIAVYDGAELVSEKEIKIDGFTSDTAIRMFKTSDGTEYLITCEMLNSNLMDYGRYGEGEEAKIKVYCEVDGGYTLALEKQLGDFAADGLFVSNSLDSADCLVYASNGDVYYVDIKFEAKN